LPNKERITDNYDIGCELCAFCNTKGGKLLIGVKDKTGKTNPLSYVEIQETTNRLSNIASENVVPSIRIDVENVKVNGGVIVIASIPQGKDKPYHDNKGIIWMKNGTDKRRVFEKSEIAEMMEECGTFRADEAIVPDATFDDLDDETIKKYLYNRFAPKVSKADFKLHGHSSDELASFIIKGKTAKDLLSNLNFIRQDGKITVAAMLLFGKYPQRFLPTFTAKCISFWGNSIGGDEFRDKVHDADMEGNLLHQYETIMSFFNRNLRRIQVERNFNTLGEVEVSIPALGEFTVNTLIHRSLNWRAPARFFIFDDRIEIHTPGALPKGITVEDIKSGVSMPRNNFLFQNAIFLLPYTGAGSGVVRAIETCPEATFSSKENIHEFIVTIPRRSNQEKGETIQEDAKCTKKMHQEGRECTKMHQETHQDALRRPLTKKEEDICNFCTVPRTAAEIMERLGILNQSRSRKAHIGVLLKLGVLEMTDPEHPNSRNQKYRKKQ